MKLKAAVCAVILSASFLTFASGCNISDFGTENLLRPPTSMGDEAEIEQLISDTAKNNYILKYPKSGNYRSAITMTDLNGDGTDEAVAFYRKGNDTAIIHMLVIFFDNDKWKLSSDNVIETTDIDSIDFADIDGNGSLEILSGYTTYSTNVNRLECYAYSQGKTSNIKSGQNYSSFYCGDFDSDGVDEVITLLLYTTENEACASMLDYSESKKSLYSKASVPMDPNIVKYKNVTVASFDNNIQGVVVDGSFVNDELNTQVIYYSTDLSLLRNPLFSEKKKNITQRGCSVIASDIDRDDLIEIPVVTKLPRSKNESEQNVADKIEWNSFSAVNETTTAKMYMIANYNKGYSIKMPESWIGDTVTADFDQNNDTMRFYAWKKNGPGELLFEIKVFDIADWDIGKNIDKYTLISKDDIHAYTFLNINTKNQYSLSDDEIKTAFSVFNELAV